MAQAGAQSPLDYAEPNARRCRGVDTCLRTALACGLIPAVLGTTIIAAWMFTRWPALQLLGFANILLGLLCTAIGVPALFVHFRGGCQTHDGSLRRRLLPGVVAGAVLIANFPLCSFYLRASSLRWVRVVNATGATVSSFVVADPAGQRWELGPIPAGGRRRRMIGAQGEGAITFSTTINGTPLAGEVESYITDGLSAEDRTVTLNADGTHSVR